MLGFTSWVLSKEDRRALRGIMKDGEQDVFVGHHITYEYGIDEADAKLPVVNSAKVVGKVEAEGMQVLVVELNGDRWRTDGEPYHITWSYNKASGRRSVDSAAVIRRNTIVPLDDIASEFVLTGLIPAFSKIT